MNIGQQRMLRMLRCYRIQQGFSNVAPSVLRKHYEDYVEQVELTQNSAMASKFFQRAYDLHQKDLSIAKKASETQVQAVFLSKSPIQSILRVYLELKQTRLLNAGLIANTLLNIGRVKAFRQNRQAVFWDLDGARLEADYIYEILLKDTRRVIQETQVIDLLTLANMLKGLRFIGVKDYELTNLILEKVNAICEIPNQDHPLYKAERFTKLINHFIKVQEAPKAEGDEVEQLFHEFKQTLQNERKKVLRLLDSINLIKENYQKLLVIQEKQFVSENINLNLQLLDLEEQLIDCGLLTIEEVEAVETESNQDSETKFGILLSKAMAFSTQFQNLGVLFTHQDSSKQIIDLRPQLNFDDLAVALHELSEYLNSCGKKDGLVNEEWVNKLFKDQPHYDRGLSSAFMAGQESFARYYSSLLDYIYRTGTKPSNESAQLLSLAFAKMGHSTQSAKFQEMASVASEGSLQHLLQTATIRGLKLDQRLTTKLLEVFNFDSRSDEELTQIALGLIVQHSLYGSDIGPLSSIFDTLIDRFRSIETIGDLDPATTENLIDIQTYCQTTGANEQLYKLIVGAQGTNRFVPELSNPYIQFLSNLFDESPVMKQAFHQFSIKPHIYAQAGGRTIGLVLLPEGSVDVNGEPDGRTLFRKHLLQQYADSKQLNLEIRTLALNRLLKYNKENQHWEVLDDASISTVISKTLEITDTDHQLSHLLLSIDTPYASLKHEYDRLKELVVQLGRCGSSISRNILLEDIQFQLALLIEQVEKPNQVPLNKAFEICRSLHKQSEAPAKPYWSGSIQTQDVPEYAQSFEGFCAAIANENTFIHHEYVTSSLRAVLQTHGLLNQSMWQRLTFTSTSAQLALYPNITVNPTNQQPWTELYPNHQAKRKQIQPQFRVDWRDLFRDFPLEERRQVAQLNEFLKQDQDLTGQAGQDGWFALNLLNLKAELVDTMQPHEIVQRIFGLDIWDKVIEDKLQKRQGNAHLLNRKGYPKPTEKPLITQSYLDSAIRDTRSLRALLQTKNEIIRKIQLDYSNKVISFRGASQTIRQVKRWVLQGIKQFKRRIAPKHRSFVYSRHQKYIDVKLQSSKSIALIRSAHRSLPLAAKPDRIQTERSRAEDKLILYRILFRIQQGQPLGQPEKAFLDHLRTTSSLRQYTASITSLAIKDLSAADREFFAQLNHSSINRFEQYSLNEVFVELATFFDDALYADYIHRFALAKYNLRHRSFRRGANLYLYKKEQETWAKASSLDQKELSKLKEMLAIPLNLQSLDADVQYREKTTTEQSLDLLNKLPFPQAIITEWVNSRQEEISSNSDSTLLDEHHQNLELWQAVFGQSYEKTTSEQISRFVESVCQRMMMIKTYKPFFLRRLFKMLFTHPKFNPMSRKLLAGYIEIFNIQVPFTSKDIIDIAESALNRQQQPNHQPLLDQQFPYEQHLWNKLGQL